MSQGGRWKIHCTTDMTGSAMWGRWTVESMAACWRIPTGPESWATARIPELSAARIVAGTGASVSGAK
jgi:hypothetical protein